MVATYADHRAWCDCEPCKLARLEEANAHAAHRVALANFEKHMAEQNAKRALEEQETYNRLRAERKAKKKRNRENNLAARAALSQKSHNSVPKRSPPSKNGG